MNNPQQIAVIGAGPMGLMCAYELCKKGYKVTIFEKDDRIGGMSASFDFNGLMIERYYHYICGPDKPLFDLLTELKIEHTLKWTNTKMGFFYEGHLYNWGTPIDLLLFPKIDIVSKLRYGILLFLSSKRKNWLPLDKIDVITWLTKNMGQKAYKVFWESLFHYKFYDLKNNLSAAWIWSRLKRMALSRKNLFTEQLGYLEGKSEILLNTLVEKIKQNGGQINLQQEVSKINFENGKVKSIMIKDKEIPFQYVISTIPLPYVPEIIPDAPTEMLESYKKIKNIAVICCILKLKHPISKNFWMNISDHSMNIPGIIEYSNLVPMKENILYIPYYVPQNNPLYSQKDEYFHKNNIDSLKKINPSFEPDWIIDTKLFRLKYAQPVCPPHFSDILPPIKTPIQGLYIADTSHYYPEDRSISESIRVGKEIAQLLK